MYDTDLFLNIGLPEKLNKKETKEYFEKYKNGDSRAREKLILYNIKLVIYRINSKFSKFPFDQEEMFSVGVIGLIQSIDTFDIEKGYEFSSYAIRCIDNMILMFARKESKNLEVSSLNKTIGSDKNGNDLKIENTIVDDTIDLANDYEKKDEVRILKKLMEDLSEDEMNLLNLYFKDRITQQEIVNQQQISKSYVSKKIRNIVNKLSKAFNIYNEAEYQNATVKKNVTSETIKCNKKEKYLSKK